MLFEKTPFFRVTYPKGKIGSENSGAQFRMMLPKGERDVCEYRVRFGPDFVDLLWRQHVKLGTESRLCNGFWRTNDCPTLRKGKKMDGQKIAELSSTHSTLVPFIFLPANLFAQKCETINFNATLRSAT